MKVKGNLKYEKENKMGEIANKVFQHSSLEQLKWLNEKYIERKYDFFGTWYIDKVALISEMYTGTESDGDFPENLYDVADYIGYELEYNLHFFRLGDAKYEKPIYTMEKENVGDIQRGGRKY